MVNASARGADDFIIATGIQHSVRDFIEMSAKRLGFTIIWEGKGIDEVGVVGEILTSEASEKCPALRLGMIIIRIDPRYFRPTEVQTLLGDPTKAYEKLGWSPTISLSDTVDEMIDSDLLEARRMVTLNKAGLNK